MSNSEEYNNGNGKHLDHENEEARSVTDRAKEKAERAAHAVKERTAYMAECGIDKGSRAVGDRIDAVAGSIGEIGETLRQENAASAAHYVNLASQKVDSVGRYLHDSDPQDILEDVAGYARRHPEIVITAAIAGGLLLGRFLKSSSESRQVDAEASRYEDDTTEDTAPQQTFAERRHRAKRSASSRPRWQQSTGPNRRPVRSEHYQRRASSEFPSNNRSQSVSSSPLMSNQTGGETNLAGGLAHRKNDHKGDHSADE